MAETVSHKQIPVYFDQMVDDVFLNGVAKRPAEAAKRRRAAAEGRGAAAGAAPLTPPPNDSVNAPIAMFSRHNGGWTVVFSIADPTLGISWRIGETGEFRETGFIDTLDPRTRKRMPNPSIELAADAPAATIQVRYVDANGELQGPFPIRFDPEAALIRDQRKILDMTATSWLSFREFNGLLVYYTHLMSYRCAIREVRIGIDTAVPDKVLKMPPCDPEDPSAIPARGAALSEARAVDQFGLGGTDLSRRQRLRDQELQALDAAPSAMIENPPSTGIAVPVTKSEAREARNTAMPAKSSIAPQRAAGVRASTLVVQAVDLLAGALGEVGVDPARQHRVDLDVVGRPGHRAGARELHDAALAGGVGRREAGAEDRHHRADIDDLAAARRLHGRVDRLRAQEGAGEVGLDHAVPFREIELVRRLADVDAGIVDENVDAAELAADALDHGGDRGLVGDVGGDRDRPGAAPARARRPRPPTWPRCGRRPRPPAPASRKPRAMPRPMPPLPPVTMATLPVRSKSSVVMVVPSFCRPVLCAERVSG